MIEKFLISPSDITFVDNHKRDPSTYSKTDLVRYTANGFCHVILKINGEQLLKTFNIKCFGRTKREAREAFHWQVRQVSTRYLMKVVNNTEEVCRVVSF